ncbi:SMR family transporter [Acuticoccus sp.]|uniref:SMR family transporter n=1 Tax=Acuticoccus sp. TaxID=1904378 RepID=UPI003B526E02
MAWIHQIAAGILEVARSCLGLRDKAVGRLHAPRPGVMVVMVIGSVSLLSVSMRTLPLGTAYPI